MRNSRRLMLFIIASFAAAALAAAGCGGGGAPVQSANLQAKVPVIDFRTTAKAIANPGNITYTVELLKGGYDAGADSTGFVYKVVSNPGGGPALGYWMLLIPEKDAAKVKIIASNDKKVEFGYSGATKHFGIKFDTSYKDNETRIVTLTLAGRWAVRDIDIVIKAGNGYVSGRAPGPSLEPAPLTMSGSFFNISPGISEMINPGNTGWSYAGFVSARNFTVLALALNYSIYDGGLEYNAGSWFIGNLYNPQEKPLGDDPVMFVLINWGRFMIEMSETGVFYPFPGYIDGVTTFSGGTFIISYGTIDGGPKQVSVTIPPVSIPADAAQRYPGLGNPFLDVMRAVAFYIASDGSVIEIRDSTHFMELYGLR